MATETVNEAQSGDVSAIDLHDVYRRNSACGYVRHLHLRSHEAGDLAARLRGIQAISAVLIATAISEQLTLGDYLQGGLVEAIHALAFDAGSSLDEINGQDRFVTPDGEVRHG